MYSNIRDWFVHASGRHDYNGLDNTRLDFSANVGRYDQLLEDSGVSVAQQQSYLELNASDKFFYRTDVSFWGSTNIIELYKKIYDYNYTDIPYTGTWGFIPSEFASNSDNLEEIFENREQIEISKHYEKLPKAVTISL